VGGLAPRIYSTRHAVRSRLVFPDGDGTDEVRYQSGDPHSRRIRRVCAICNNGWKSSLQASAKPFLVPMLKGGETRLHGRAQTILSSWVAMMVMTAEFIDLDKVAISAEDRHFLRQNGFPPPHWRIWIGAGGRRQFPRWTHNVMAFARNKGEVFSPSAAPASNTQTSTICLGDHVVIHAMSSVVAEDIIRKWKLPPQIDFLMSQIWPVRQSHVNWTRKAGLTDAGIERLADQLFLKVHNVAQRVAEDI